MQKYVSLLSGINVSGQKKITMAALCDLYRQIDLGQAQSYIQSGNVLFTSGISDMAKLRRRIESPLRIGLDLRSMSFWHIRGHKGVAFGKPVFGAGWDRFEKAPCYLF